MSERDERLPAKRRASAARRVSDLLLGVLLTVLQPFAAVAAFMAGLVVALLPLILFLLPFVLLWKLLLG